MHSLNYLSCIYAFFAVLIIMAYYTFFVSLRYWFRGGLDELSKVLKKNCFDRNCLLKNFRRVEIKFFIHRHLLLPILAKQLFMVWTGDQCNFIRVRFKATIMPDNIFSCIYTFYKHKLLH